MRADSVDSPWRDRRLLLVLSANLVSQVGSGVSKIAILWLSYDLTRSATATGIVFLCFTAPGVVMGSVAGALADRFPKRHLLVVARLACSVIVLGFLPAYWNQSAGLVHVTVFLLGMAVPFINGPLQAYLPELFAEERLPRVNSALQTNRSVAMMVGPALGGVILGTAGAEAAFLIDSASFAASALLLLTLPVVAPRLQDGATTLRGLYSDIGRGLAYISQSAIHRFLFLLFVPLLGIYCISGGLLMPYCEKLLAGQWGLSGASALATLQAAMGIGALAGTFYIPIVMAKIGALRALLMGSLLCAVELFAMASIPVLGVVVAVLLFTASSMPLLLIPLTTVLQQRTERELRGRVMGALDTVLLATLSLSFGIGGVLAEAIGLLVTFGVTAFAMLVLTAVVPLLRSYRDLVVREAVGSPNPP